MRERSHMVGKEEEGRRKKAQKKQFTNVQYTTGATSAMVSGQGEANNSLEVMVLENGDLSLAGMVFKAEE